jgi:hypothetical protein
MAANKDLQGTDFRVLLYFICNLTFENFVHIAHVDVAEYLKIRPEQVSKSIEKLIRTGFILIGPSKGHFKTYQINPASAYFGKIEHGVKERRSIIRQGREKVLSFKRLDQG